jgi:hypothetical protein
MSYSNYRYDENDRKLEETSKRLPENFDDIMKGHKQEMIQLYQNEFNSALRLTEDCSKRGNRYATAIFTLMVMVVIPLVLAQAQLAEANFRPILSHGPPTQLTKFCIAYMLPGLHEKTSCFESSS